MSTQLTPEIQQQLDEIKAMNSKQTIPIPTANDEARIYREFIQRDITALALGSDISLDAVNANLVPLFEKHIDILYVQLVQLVNQAAIAYANSDQSQRYREFLKSELDRTSLVLKTKELREFYNQPGKHRVQKLTVVVGGHPRNAEFSNMAPAYPEVCNLLMSSGYTNEPYTSWTLCTEDGFHLDMQKPVPENIVGKLFLSPKPGIGA